MSDELPADAAAIVRGVLEARVLPAAAELSEQLASCLSLAMTQLLGVAAARFVLDVELITAMSRQELSDMGPVGNTLGD